MREPAVQIRDARSSDEVAIRSCVEAAYSLYVDRIAKPPAPMLADYGTLIARDVVRVATSDAKLVGLIVMWPEIDHLYVDNIAVHPDAQGRGVGSALLVDADRAAAANDKAEIRLYTNEAMTENLNYYPLHGFVETRRAAEDGYNRVYFSRLVALQMRAARPTDHDWVVDVVDEWWGRPVVAAVPRLFFDHFHSTSLIAELDGEAVGFLIGFMSPSQPDVGYIHFVGVNPAHRSRSIGRLLYERFFTLAQDAGRIEVAATTSALNTGSIDFHRRMGFDVSDPVEGLHRRGVEHVAFRRLIPTRPRSGLSAT